jgi:cellulose synthase/poly-beta-1,6-N-acetylglucosamine synthase-like glycosyltransferase
MQKRLKISIGICCYNEEENIGALLKNLLEQEFGENELLEIIIVASGCTDNTIQIIKEWQKKDDRIKLIEEPERRGKAKALNKILSSYKGDILIHLDADHIPGKGAFQHLLRHFSNQRIGGVSGYRVPYSQGKFMDKINEIIWSLYNETQIYLNELGLAQHLGGALFAIRKGLCKKVPEDIVNDDAFIGIKCKQKGYLIHFEKNAVTFFQGVRTVRDFIIQRRRVIYGHFKVKQRTGVMPLVFEACPLKIKINIIARWLRGRMHLTPYFPAACILELCANLFAIVDLLKGGKKHVIWKIAETTKRSILHLSGIG